MGGPNRPPDGLPRSSRTPLSSSGELLGVAAGVLEASRGLLGGVLVCLGQLGANRAPKGWLGGLEMELPADTDETLIFMTL